MTAGALRCPLSGHEDDGSLDDGTLARWLMPAPGPMCSLPALAPRATRARVQAPQPVPDVGYLFKSCRQPQRGVSDADFDAAAATLGVEAAVIRAVAEVETSGDAFDGQGRPRILFERHHFHRHTGGRHSRLHPDISNAQAGGYGRFSAQYGKLERAHALDATAALKSASWGRFQIMGSNHAAAGYPTVQHMVDAMARSEREHLLAFVRFVNHDRGMADALRRKDWAGFARRYNGRNYAANAYDTKLEAAYRRLAPLASPTTTATPTVPNPPQAPASDLPMRMP